MKQKSIMKKSDFVISISIDMEEAVRMIMKLNRMAPVALFNKNKTTFNVTGKISFDLEKPLDPEIKIKLNAV